MIQIETNLSNPCGNNILEDGSNKSSESKDDRSSDNPAKRARHDREHDPVRDSIAVNAIKTSRKSILKGSSFSSNKTLTTSSTQKNARIVINLEQNRTLLIPTRHDFTHDEIEALWYHSLERQAMVQGALKTAADLTPHDDLARGLEHYTPEGGTCRYWVRQKLYQRIFQEQEQEQQQQQTQSDDPSSAVTGGEERIGAISVSISRQSQAEAHQRAYRDELALVYTPEQIRILVGSMTKHNNDGILAGWTQTLRDIGWLGVSPQ